MIGSRARSPTRSDRGGPAIPTCRSTSNCSPVGPPATCWRPRSPPACWCWAPMSGGRPPGRCSDQPAGLSCVAPAARSSWCAATPGSSNPSRRAGWPLRPERPGRPPGPSDRTTAASCGEHRPVGRRAGDPHRRGVPAGRPRLQAQEARGHRLPRLQHPAAAAGRLPPGGRAQPQARPRRVPRDQQRVRRRRSAPHRTGRSRGASRRHATHARRPAALRARPRRRPRRQPPAGARPVRRGVPRRDAAHTRDHGGGRL